MRVWRESLGTEDIPENLALLNPAPARAAPLIPAAILGATFALRSHHGRLDVRPPGLANAVRAHALPCGYEPQCVIRQADTPLSDGLLEPSRRVSTAL